MLCKRFFYY